MPCRGPSPPSAIAPREEAGRLRASSSSPTGSRLLLASAGRRRPADGPDHTGRRARRYLAPESRFSPRRPALPLPRHEPAVSGSRQHLGSGAIDTPGTHQADGRRVVSRDLQHPGLSPLRARGHAHGAAVRCPAPARDRSSGFAGATTSTPESEFHVGAISSSSTGPADLRGRRADLPARLVQPRRRTDRPGIGPSPINLRNPALSPDEKRVHRRRGQRRRPQRALADRQAARGGHAARRRHLAAVESGRPRNPVHQTSDRRHGHRAHAD